MKRNAKTAFTALKRINAPVFNHCEAGESLDNQWGAHFILSAELEKAGDSLFADYYGDEIVEYRDSDTGEIINAFGIRQCVIDILSANGLYAEYIDPGTVGIYDA